MAAKVGIVLVSHSAPLAEGTAELAGQIGGGTVIIATAGGTDDGRIGTSIAKVQRALRLADGGVGVLILPDLGSSVLTVRALLAEPDDLPGPIAVADAPVRGGRGRGRRHRGRAAATSRRCLTRREEARHARKL